MGGGGGAGPCTSTGTSTGTGPLPQGSRPIRSRRNRNSSRPTASSGSVTNTPANPYSCWPASSAKITSSGCTPTAPPISLGITMWPSTWWMNRNASATAIAAVGDSASATAIGGIAPIHGPT